MNKHISKAARICKGAARPAAGIAAFVLGLSLLGVIEWMAARYAMAIAPQSDRLAAYQYAALGIGSALLAFVLSAVAGALKDDERPRYAEKALGVRVLAVLCLVWPVTSLSGAFAYDRQVKAFESFQASPAYEAALATLRDPRSTPPQRRTAAAQVAPPATAERGVFDWFRAGFLHWLVMMAASAGRLPARLTDAERKALADEARRLAKNEAARKRRQKARKARKGANVIPFLGAKAKAP